jgi:hypothetical protein
VDWLVEANVSENRTGSIFRAEVTTLGIEGWQDGKSDGKSQSASPHGAQIQKNINSNPCLQNKEVLETTL